MSDESLNPNEPQDQDGFESDFDDAGHDEFDALGGSTIMNGQRLSIGIEDANDIIADLDQALAAATA